MTGPLQPVHLTSPGLPAINFFGTTMDRSILKEKDKRVLKLIVEEYLGLGQTRQFGAHLPEKNVPGSPGDHPEHHGPPRGQRATCPSPTPRRGGFPRTWGCVSTSNSLLAEIPLPEGGIARSSPRTWRAKRGDLDSLLIQVSRILAEHSDNLGFVISPRVSPDPFPPPPVHEDLREQGHGHPGHAVPDGPDPDRRDRTPFTQVELDRAAQYINHELPGQEPARSSRDFLVQELPEVPAEIRGHHRTSCPSWSGPTSTRRRRRAGSSSRGPPSSSTRPSSSTWRS